MMSVCQRFSTEEAARAYMESVRWPHGPTCPHWLQTGRDLGSFVKNIDKLIPALGSKSDGSPDYEAEGWTIEK
jgi:hypothetical protein